MGKCTYEFLVIGLADVLKNAMRSLKLLYIN